MGNITRIYLKEFDEAGSLVDETTVSSYVYDSAGQLVRENNRTLEKTYVLVYDVGGNIVSKEEYEFTEETDLSGFTPTNTVSYSYDSVWKDKLVNFNGTDITYDEIGNPLNYVKQDVIDESADTGLLTWNGRQLESVTIGGTTFKYSYDVDGLRTKTEMYDSDTNQFDGAVYYLWRDGKLSGYSNVNSDGETEQTIKMLFDDTGESIGYTYYNIEDNEQATFYFGKNAFGDIVTVYGDDGDAMVSYTYDAWGAVSAKAHGTSASEIIAALVAIMFTPITYRGYNYDPNTGLYYLQSRYYNPAYGRFLNADTTDILETTKGTIHGANIFVYGNNNPLKYLDFNGKSSTASGYYNGADGSTGILIFGVFVVVILYYLIYFLIGAIASILEALIPLVTDTLDKVIDEINHKLGIGVPTTLEEQIALAKEKANAREGGRSDKTNRHHIVAKKALAAQPSRDLLERNKIGINSDENLVTMNREVHWYIHTTLYHTAVYTYLAEAEGKGNDAMGRRINVVLALTCIKGMLVS